MIYHYEEPFATGTLTEEGLKMLEKVAYANLVNKLLGEGVLNSNTKISFLDSKVEIDEITKDVSYLVVSIVVMEKG